MALSAQFRDICAAWRGRERIREHKERDVIDERNHEQST